MMIRSSNKFVVMRTRGQIWKESSLFVLGIVLALTGSGATTAFGHLPHTPHYNGGSNRDGVGNYYPYMALDPEYTPAKTPTQIMFSIQDFNGNDVYNIKTMVEIYEDITEKRIKSFSWTLHPIGDFEYYYTFPNVGNYQIVLSVARDNSTISNGKVDPSRSILDSNVGCQCDRAIFNITVSNTWGDIRNFLFALAVIMPIGVLGAVLGVSYFRGRKSTTNNSQNHDLIRYGIMLLAIAGGLVHLAIFPEHSSQQIYYSIFLLCAASAQVAYGILYILVNLAQDESAKDRNTLIAHYNKTLVVNLFGLIGTGVLVGLYTYSVIFPPPLSPTNKPEVIDIAGILAKAVEVLLIVGIVSLMIWEKRNLRKFLIRLI
jgi:hypothetical protein